MYISERKMPNVWRYMCWHARPRSHVLFAPPLVCEPSGRALSALHGIPTDRDRCWLLAWLRFVNGNRYISFCLLVALSGPSHVPSRRVPI
jgi:hypothetical protein